MASPGFNLFSQTRQRQGDNQFGNFGTGMPAPTSSLSAPGFDPGVNMFSQSATPQDSPIAGLPPGIVPSVPPNSFTPYNRDNGTPGPVEGGVVSQANGISTLMPQDPTLTTAFFNFLQSQLGGGATPFNLSAIMPSNGQATAPGTLTAPMNDIMSQLANFYKTGSGGPTGSDTLAGMAKTGNPTDVGPAWQAMVDAQQRNIGQNAANLREQFAFGGNLKSSPFGQAMTDYYTQTGKDQNALLAQMSQQAQEAARGRELQAGTTLQSGASDFATQLQGMDQASIQNLLQEFIRTRPEYAPYLNMLFSASTTYPPSIGQGVGVGGMGGALSASGSALSGLADLWGSIGKSTTQTPAG